MRYVPSSERPAPRGGLGMACVVKGPERYVFLWDDAHAPELLRTLGRFAAHPELSFTWYDAALVAEKLRQAQPAPKGCP